MTENLTTTMVYRHGGQERQQLTAVLQKWRCSASYDSEVVYQNLVLRMKFSGENRHLRKAAKRQVQAVITRLLKTYSKQFQYAFSIIR